MTKDQAINYLLCSAMSQEQVDAVVEAMSQEQVDAVVEALSGKCDECPCFNVGYICGHNDAMCGGLDPILFHNQKGEVI